MKKIIVILLCIVSEYSYSQFGKVEIDFKKPESVVNAVIFAANNSELSILNCICNPIFNGNESVEFLRKLKEDGGNAALGDSEAMDRVKLFYDNFIGASICGATTFEKSNEKVSYSYAIVPLKLKSEVVNIKLIKFYGNWYLQEF